MRQPMWITNLLVWATLGGTPNSVIPVWIGFFLLHGTPTAAQQQENCSIDISITAVGHGPFADFQDPSFQKKKNLWIVASSRSKASSVSPAEHHFYAST